jgi:hypothetical protein
LRLRDKIGPTICMIGLSMTVKEPVLTFPIVVLALAVTLFYYLKE